MNGRRIDSEERFTVVPYHSCEMKYVAICDMFKIDNIHGNMMH